MKWPVSGVDNYAASVDTATVGQDE